ncbi:hypothetical protein CK203_110119 [Vitis vinifera]|uniref:RNase H type-1 domain-containing protein n=1 Tax=Vitis vinifera TaxID=29760 RepID=A0A438CRE1_VITVI|nr:hypothetical protein CK203_110119 [Vitis vinifera]
MYLGLETALELGIRQMEVFGDSNLVLRQIQGEWKTRDVKLRPYHAYLELLVARFEDLRYTHLPRAQNQFADALATLASMIDIPADATIDDGLPWYHDIYHFLRLGVYPEAATAKDRRALRQLATRFSDARGSCGSLRTTYGRTYVGRKIMRTGYFWLTMETIVASSFRDVRVSDTWRSHSRAALELHALTSPWPFSVWGIDIIGKISPKSSSGHEFILVAIDYFTKWVEAARATPYSLVYGMEAVLPVEIEMGSLRVALEQQIPETDWAQARFDQLNLLDERRLRAADHVRAYQRKMARAFKKRVKPRPLHVEGAAWLMDLDGNQFSEPTNVDQLKRITCLMMDDSMLPLFPDLSHIRCHNWGIFRFGGSLWIFAEVTCSRIDDSMLSDLRPILHFRCHTGHISVQMRFTDHEGVACLSLFARCAWISRVIISVGYISDMLRVPSVLFSGYQDRSDTSDAILGHISPTLFPCSLAFRAAVHSRFTTFRVIIITSQFRRSELSSVFRSTFRVASSVSAFRVVITSQFDVQSHHHHFSVSAFRAIIGFQIDIQSHILESSSSLLSFGVQSYHRFSDRHSESHPRFRRSESLSLLSLTFRVIIITSQFRRSELSSVFRSTFRVASSVSAFRVVITSQFDVQSHHHHFSVSAFRAIIGFQIDIQSRILVSAFRVVITSQFDVQSHHHHFSVSAFRAIIGFQIDIQSRILGFGVQSRYHFSV